MAATQVYKLANAQHRGPYRLLTNREATVSVDPSRAKRLDWLYLKFSRARMQQP